MIHELVNLSEIYPLNDGVTLEIYVSNEYNEGFREHKGLLIIPGGGYENVSNSETDPIAFAFLLRGYNCFALNYTVTRQKSFAKPTYPAPQLEVMAAMDFIYKNAAKYHVIPSEIYGVGFSAGAHLIGSYSFLYNNGDLLGKIGVKDPQTIKPKAICLAYPVISLDEFAHEGSALSLVENNKELRRFLSIQRQVTSDYPPTFLWTTLEDTCVPPENTKMMDEALNKANVKHETVYYKRGWHGLSLATKFVTTDEFPEVATWVEKCDNFWSNL